MNDIKKASAKQNQLKSISFILMGMTLVSLPSLRAVFSSNVSDFIKAETTAILALVIFAVITGIRNSGKPEKSKICIVLGIILTAFRALDLILAFSFLEISP